MNDTNTNNDSTLIINLNEEYKIKIEDGKNFNTSIFKEVYEAALKNVEEIVEQSSKNNTYDDFNNIIAFTGERGKGKSSSMISFRDALVGKNSDNHKSFFSNSVVLANTQFATIDIVDPSLFRGGESLFEIILAQMFDKFQNKISKHDCNLSDDSRRNIIKQFQQVFENLQIINSDRKELYKKESIEALSRLATSSNLRKCFKDLIAIYLKEFEEKKDFLVIAIDDFDLNISGAYEMLEDIRQFLIQSNIILLVACKIEQLRETINVKLNNQKLSIDFEKKSEKYLEKLIPFTRRLVLPDVKKIKKIDFEIRKGNSVLFESNSSNLYEIVKNDLYNNFKLVFKTNQVGYIFNLDTIRGIQNFFNLSNSNNISILKKYILNEIEKNKIEFDFFKSLDDVKIEHCNLTIIKFLFEKYKISELRTLSISKIPERISIGDVIYSMKCFEDKLSFNDYPGLKFISTLKAFYSILIQEQELINNEIYSEFARYGFISFDFKILAENDKGQSRDHFTYGGKDEQIKKLNIESLDQSNLFLLSQFIYILGDNKNYRIEYEKDTLTDSYKKITLSPFSLLNNIYNYQPLFRIFKIKEEEDFVIKNLKWFKNSIFIKQLFNPSFSINYFDNLSSFRKLHIKEELPDNYFDCFILLFVYGSIYSINNKDLVEDFISYPIIKVLLFSFHSRNKKSFSIINKLSEEYPVLKEYDENNDLVSDDLIKIINSMYSESGQEVEATSKESQIFEKLKILLKRIKDRPNYKIQTLSTIINEIKDIDEFNSEVDNLSSFKEGINSLDDSMVKETKQELLKYLTKKING
ncbi:hypothetical protein EG240_15680 [Paenimyroides tangerinum]|uniref:KAP NTPase domain-containing protein n=1 Tax=Paenimyroides tangerinum TaxID=2488728 RepID=A0A3P3VXZ9_9FLAO|nr:hypothetical protein [Paenimyroides tangerinum]RRJ86908.1 hypothetical protein EG240_15680 [Paenimyroides tangerinum]